MSSFYTSNSSSHRSGGAGGGLGSSFFSSSSSSSSSSSTPWSALASFSPLHPMVQSHLVRVYTTLTTMTLFTTAGVYMDLSETINRGGTFTMLATAGLFLFFQMLPSTKENESLRSLLLYSFSFFQGLSLAPLIELVGYVHPSILPQAVLSTFLIFGSFSLAAVFSKNQRGFLFLGGFLLSAMSSMLCLSVFNIFMRSRMLWNAELYLGLVVFSLFILYDTQVIIYRASQGSKDHLRHAANLFVDLVDVFIRILTILAKNNNDRKREESNNRTRRR